MLKTGWRKQLYRRGTRGTGCASLTASARTFNFSPLDRDISQCRNSKHCILLVTTYVKMHGKEIKNQNATQTKGAEKWTGSAVRGNVISWQLEQRSR